MSIYLYASTYRVKNILYPLILSVTKVLSDAMMISQNLILWSLKNRDCKVELAIGIPVSEVLTFLSAAVLTLTAESFIKILS